MVEEGDLHEELGECAGLDVVVVGLADATNPSVRRAVRRDVELETLERQTESGAVRTRTRATATNLQDDPLSL